jgi:hypothetical protein
MGADHQAEYLAGVPAEQAELLARVNTAGLRKLRSYLDSGQAVAFLGAGSSAPVYPLWAGVIAELINAAAEQGLGEEAATTCRAMAAERPDTVVELVRRDLRTTVLTHLGPPSCRHHASASYARPRCRLGAYSAVSGTSPRFMTKSRHRSFA